MTPSILFLLVAVTNGCFLLSQYLKKKEEIKKKEIIYVKEEK